VDSPGAPGKRSAIKAVKATCVACFLQGKKGRRETFFSKSWLLYLWGIGSHKQKTL
jgi:hypothetical protein